jgi:hypothetical protein
MEKNIAFWIIAAALVFALFYGPVKHLCTGVVEFKKISYPNGKNDARSIEREKFYSYVALEIGCLIYAVGFSYWLMFLSNLKAK